MTPAVAPYAPAERSRLPAALPLAQAMGAVFVVPTQHEQDDLPRLLPDHEAQPGLSPPRSRLTDVAAGPLDATGLRRSLETRGRACLPRRLRRGARQEAGAHGGRRGTRTRSGAGMLPASPELNSIHAVTGVADRAVAGILARAGAAREAVAA
jgi:hypothetical protein